MPDGKPNFQGIWQAVTSANAGLEDHVAGNGMVAGRSVVVGGTIPYKPEAAAQRAENIKNRAQADPYRKRFLPGTPRIMYLDYPFQIFQTRDTVGMITEIKENATELAPFVNRDSAYKYVLGTLNAGYTNLQAGGAAFPFTLHAGFTGFNTPATFGQFNRALAARAYAYYATFGGGAAAWQSPMPWRGWTIRSPACACLITPFGKARARTASSPPTRTSHAKAQPCTRPMIWMR